MSEQSSTQNGMHGGYVILYAVVSIILFAMGFVVGMLV